MADTKALFTQRFDAARTAWAQGDEPGDSLHFIYGLLPLLAVAYPYALRGDDGRRNLLLFTVGSALVAALGVRAFMTGPS